MYSGSNASAWPDTIHAHIHILRVAKPLIDMLLLREKVKDEEKTGKQNKQTLEKSPAVKWHYLLGYHATPWALPVQLNWIVFF